MLAHSSNILRSVSGPPALIVLFLAVILAPASSQSVDVPITHRAYEFLTRMESKGLLVEYRDAVRPLSRQTMARHLLALSEHQAEPTSYEKRELSYLLGGFAQEVAQLRQDDRPVHPDRWRPVSLPLKDGRMNVGVIAGYRTRFVEGKDASIRQAGFQVYGHMFSNLGFSFTFVSLRETGPLVAMAKLHTPDQGVAFFNTPGNVGGYEYNTTEASLSYDLGDLSVALEKTNNRWGEDRWGNVILSPKSPSFPKLSLRVSITDWLDFSYIHGDLHSLVTDSARSYIDNGLYPDLSLRTVYRKKFLASHILQASPWDWMDLALGESIVYADRDPQLIYLLPIMFFKSGEHYNRDTDNTHIFGAVDVRLSPGVSLYGSIFIDELNAGAIFDPEENRNWFATSVGTRVYDLPIEDIEMFAEYTRSNPWVYVHKYKATSYTNNGFELGHWIGQNADLLSAEVRYRPTRASQVSVLYQQYRKGDTLDVWHQYNPPTEQFLHGRVRKESSVTFTASYEFLRDAFAEVQYRRATLSNAQEPLTSFTGRHEFLIRVRYGVW